MTQEHEVTRFELKDKASSYNRSISDKLLTWWFMIRFPKLRIGENTIIKQGNLFKLTDNARFNVGDYSVIKERSIFLLTKPNPWFDMGNYSGIGERAWISIKDHLKIGDYVRIGPDVCITDNEHTFLPNDLIMNQPAKIESIVIHNDVWIGRGATILKGVEIGEGSVVAAGSVVNNSIPPYQIWAGNPARYIKDRA